MRYILQHLSELYRYRVLIWNLVARELKARYRGSVFGFLWTFLNPLILMGIYTLVFSYYFRFEMPNYSAFLFSGLIPWMWFSSSVIQGVNSVVAGGSLITKVMFPPQVLPAVSVLSNMMNFIFTLPLLFVFLFIFKVKLGSALIALPVIILVQLIFTHSIVLIISALNVHFRDLQHIVGNLVTFLFFVTPIIYPLEQVPERLKKIVLLNPVAPLSIAYQDVFYYNKWINFQHIGMVFLCSIVLMIIGISVFEFYRDTFAEEV